MLDYLNLLNGQNCCIFIVEKVIWELFFLFVKLKNVQLIEMV